MSVEVEESQSRPIVTNTWGSPKRRKALAAMLAKGAAINADLLEYAAAARARLAEIDRLYPENETSRPMKDGPSQKIGGLELAMRLEARGQQRGPDGPTGSAARAASASVPGSSRRGSCAERNTLS